jgi:adenylate cyclase
LEAFVFSSPLAVKASMNTERAKRKLAAILSADVKGYSRLMGEDEVATVRTLETYRRMIASLIDQFRGRVVDSPGDNILAEFASVVDAVEAAVEIQKELRKRNAPLPENRKMEFRIGINLGDVIEEGERIYGDGVNVASRLEGLADGGGICISGSAYEQVENKVALEFDYLGEQVVKNIKKPVRVYRVLMKGKLVQGTGREFPLPDKPSIAVLPFVNMSGDPEQEYFSDGMTEDLITDLSKIAGLFVIARNSVFTYKGKAVKVDQVGRELGVQYVLEGSVRKAGGRVRITAQLVDAGLGGHLWADRYDRDLEDIFALQDEVTQQIIAALAVKLTESEQERLTRRYTDNLAAYDYFLRGWEQFHRFTKQSTHQAQQAFERAIELDSQFALAHGYLALKYWLEWSFGWSQNSQTLERAFELAQKSTILDDTLPEAHRILGNVYLWKKQHERAIAELEKSIGLNPNDADAIAWQGDVLAWAGRPEEAIALVKKAMRLNPVYPVIYTWYLGHAYFLARNYQSAIAELKRVLRRNPDFHPAHIYLAVAYGELGQAEDARVEAEEFMNKTRAMCWQDWRQRLPYKDEAVLERLFDVLSKVGVKQW